ncbi:unnamed protein product [Rhizoctonia solani]|uniref:Uncharacterized protein n=1 Tax=Rhizoctonia solani TaxID=456999 RepID=A0A8H3HPX9_9AGAM|nr:unnamed protein product [Rhizoctonia solani]
MAVVNDCSVPVTKNSDAPAANDANTSAANTSSTRIVNDYILVGIGVDTRGDPDIEAEKFIFSFNFASGKITGLSPLSGEVSNVSITVSGTVPQKNIALALVTYKGQDLRSSLHLATSLAFSIISQRRAQTSLGEAVLEDRRISTYAVHLKVKLHTTCGWPYYNYTPLEGEIFIWNRKTALLLFTIKPTNEEHLKFFTCNNRACPEFKCVSGAVDGMLSVWSAEDVERTSIAYDSPLVSDPQDSAIVSSPGTMSPEQETKGSRFM